VLPIALAPTGKCKKERELERASSKCMFTLLVLICAS